MDEWQQSNYNERPIESDSGDVVVNNRSAAFIDENDPHTGTYFNAFL